MCLQQTGINWHHRYTQHHCQHACMHNCTFSFHLKLPANVDAWIWEQDQPPPGYNPQVRQHASTAALQYYFYYIRCTEVGSRLLCSYVDPFHLRLEVSNLYCLLTKFAVYTFAGCDFHVLLAYRRFPYIDAYSDPSMDGPRNHLRIPGGSNILKFQPSCM